MELIKNSLDTIAKNVEKNDLRNTGPGLLTGKTGIAIFLFYYSRLTNQSKYAQLGADMIGRVFSEVGNGYNFPTFCDGVSGFVWAVEHLVQNNFLRREDVPFLDDMDDIVYNQMMQDVKNGGYDFLHGSIGMAMYLIERPKSEKNERYLNNFIEELEKQAVIDSMGVRWKSVPDAETGETGVNLGLAHGLPSIIIFLTKFYKKIGDKASHNLLVKSVDFLLSQKIDVNVKGSFFPNVIFDDGKVTIGRKMAWCYGDIGRGISLYRAGQTLNDKSLIDFALEILVDRAKINDLTKAGVEELGICHGTIGLAHVFNKMYSETGIQDFKEASKFWTDETFKMPKFINGLNDFEKFFPGEENKMQELGLLIGVTGIGLAFISFLSHDNLEWDKCLMLS